MFKQYMISFKVVESLLMEQELNIHVVFNTVGYVHVNDLYMIYICNMQTSIYIREVLLI